MRESVVLPAPDGEDRTSIRPRRAIASFAADGRDAVALPAALRAEAFLPPVGFRPVLVRSVFVRPVLAAGALAILKPPKRLDHDPIKLNRDHGLACLSMIFFRKPVPTFRDHALGPRPAGALPEHDPSPKPAPTFADHA